MTDLTITLETALSSPLARIRDAIAAAQTRRQARKSYLYLLDNEQARRDVGLSADDLHHELDALR